MTDTSATGAKISARQLRVNFNDGPDVLKGVDMDVAPGEFIALIGASGCGKTTLLNVLAGLVKVAGGEVHVRASQPSAGRMDICYILARDALLPWRTALSNVEYGLELSGWPKSRREETALAFLEKVGLLDYQDAYPSRLSQGMRQRVSLARAFAVDREVYLMDEPFSALDSQTKLVLHDLLLSLWESTGKTVVFVTHDIGEAITLADRVIVLSNQGTGIVAEIPVDLPRPRSADELQADERYHELFRTAWKALQGSIG